MIILIYVLKTFNTNIWNCFVNWKSSWDAWNKNFTKHPWYVWVMQRHKYISLLQGQRHISKNSSFFGLFNRKLLWWIMMGHLLVSSSMVILWIIKNITNTKDNSTRSYLMTNGILSQKAFYICHYMIQNKNEIQIPFSLLV